MAENSSEGRFCFLHEGRRHCWSSPGGALRPRAAEGLEGPRQEATAEGPTRSPKGRGCGTAAEGHALLLRNMNGSEQGAGRMVGIV